MRRRVVALFLREEQSARDELDIGRLERGRIGFEQHVGLLLERNRPRIRREVALPGDVRVGGRRRQHHRGVARDAHAARRCDRLPGRACNGVRRQRARGRESPGAVDQRAHAATDRVEVDNVEDLLLAREDEVALQPLDPDVSVLGSGHRRGIDRGGQQLLDGWRIAHHIGRSVPGACSRAMPRTEDSQRGPRRVCTASTAAAAAPRFRNSRRSAIQRPRTGWSDAKGRALVGHPPASSSCHRRKSDRRGMAGFERERR